MQNNQIMDPLELLFKASWFNQFLEEESLQVLLAIVAVAYQTATAAVSLYIV